MNQAKCETCRFCMKKPPPRLTPTEIAKYRAACKRLLAKKPKEGKK